MHVVVAIVGYRNPDDIVRCLAGLALSVHADFEVVICENGGPAAHADLVAVLPERLAGGQRVRARSLRRKRPRAPPSWAVAEDQSCL